MSVQEAWLALRDDWFGGNDALLFVASVCAVHSTVFTVLNLMLHVCYKYELFPSWRVRPPKEYPPDSLIKECLIEAAVSRARGADGPAAAGARPPPGSVCCLLWRVPHRLANGSSPPLLSPPAAALLARRFPD